MSGIRLSGDTKKAIISDYENGVPNKEIYVRYNTNNCTVFRIVKAAGVLREKNLVSEETKRLLLNPMQMENLFKNWQRISA